MSAIKSIRPARPPKPDIAKALKASDEPTSRRDQAERVATEVKTDREQPVALTSSEPSAATLADDEKEGQENG
jgi:hypothetical protein